VNKFEKRSKEAYDEKAAGYDTSFEGQFTVRFKELLLETVRIKPSDNVLDIACGNGRLLRMFAEKQSFNGYGADISEQMIEQAKKINPDMLFLVGNCEQIPLPDQTCEVITVCAAYHHFPHVGLFSKEAYRLMKKGGSIYIADVYYPAVIRILCNPFVPLMKDGDVKFYSPAQIIRTLNKAGFLNATYTIHDHIQIVSARK